MKSCGFLALGMVAVLFHTATYAVNIATVPIGNPGNPADRRYGDELHPDGVGAVGYNFRIGKTEITNVQYVEFLNAVAAADPYELYSPKNDDPYWGGSRSGIVRSGPAGSYTYEVKAPALDGTYTYKDKPVVLISSGDAMRFANWLHNGQPTGAENASTTEDGAYTLNGAVTDAALAAVTRNAGARWWLPSEDEWYKSAYHKNDGVTGNYWSYSTGTNSLPNNNPPSGDTGDSVNYWDEWENDFTTGDSDYPLTDAGAYTLSGSPYGTFDQGGNVLEWTDSLFLDSNLLDSYRYVRGCSWGENWVYLQSSYWDYGKPTRETFSVGFRVARALLTNSTRTEACPVV